MSTFVRGIIPYGLGKLYRLGRVLLRIPSWTVLDGPMRIPYLPTELIDIIMDVLQDRSDKHTLSVYSSVSPIWLHLSRKRLFKHPHTSTAKLSRLLRFMDSDCGYTICDYVHSLSIGFRSAFVEDVTTLMTFLAKLPHIHGLSVDELSFRGPRIPQLGFGLQPSNKVHTLKLTRLGRDKQQSSTISEFVNFLQSFPQINTLYINGVDCEWDGELQALVEWRGVDLLRKRYNISSQLHLESLIVLDQWGFSEAIILEIVRRTLSVQTLRTLEITCSEFETLTSLFGLLTDPGCSVKDLIIRMATDDDEEADDTWYAAYAKLSSCVSLRSLGIRLGTGLERSTDVLDLEKSWSHAWVLLQHLPLKTARVHLTVPYYFPILVDKRELRDLDSTLCHLPELESFTVAVFHGPINDVQMMESSVGNALPQAFRRGLLRFQS